MIRRLTPKEADVIRAMRESPRAHKAIYRYAEAFTGDEQSFTTEKWSDRYEEAY